MYLSIIFNFTFLISVISLLQFVLKDSSIKLEWTFSRKIIAGLFIGAVGVFLMLTSINFSTTVQFDMRYVAFIIAATYGGPLVSFVTATFMFLTNFVFLEEAASNHIIIIVNTSLFLYFNIIAYYKFPRRKLYAYYSLGMIALMTTGSSLLHLWSTEYLIFLFVYLSVNILAGYIVLNFIDYTYESLLHYRHLKISHEIDYLTQIHNVHAFEEKLSDMIYLARENKQSLIMLMIDIDFFKKVNDFYGHDIGDIVLFELANILKDQTRPGDLVARKGGEEFAIILNNCTYENGLMIAERIRQVVAEFIFVKETSPISISISTGLAIYPNDAKTSKDLIKASDLALYLAKANGRNRVENYQNLKRIQSYIRFNQSGNNVVDSEHQELVDLFSTITSDFLNNASVDELKNKIYTLKTHFEEHCTSEEYQYSLYQVPSNLLSRHHEIHQELILLFDSLASRLEENIEVLDSEYFTVLSNIIVGHIQTDDTSLFKYLKT